MSLSGADAKSNSSLNYLALYSENEFHRVLNEGGLVSLSLSLFFPPKVPTVWRARQGQLHIEARSDVCLMLEWQIKAR